MCLKVDEARASTSVMMASFHLPRDGRQQPTVDLLEVCPWGLVVGRQSFSKMLMRVVQVEMKKTAVRPLVEVAMHGEQRIFLFDL